jgi:hypothetical protein
MKQLFTSCTPVWFTVFWLVTPISWGDHSARGQAATDTATPAKRPVAVTISKATTYITEPLKADGYPDYTAALNRLASEGVTPENNAAVPLGKIIGSKSVDAKIRDALASMLGSKPPQTDGRFVDYYAYVEKHAPEEDKWREKDGDLACPAYDQWERVAGDPWSKKECPLVARWLADNEIALASAIEATKRTQYYVPFNNPEGPAIGRNLETFSNNTNSLKQIAVALHARAMLRLHDGNVEEAWSDLQACHRLSRLLGQGKTAVQGLLANHIDAIAYDGQCRVAHFARLTPEQSRWFRADLDRLSPLPHFAEFQVTEERCLFLDQVCAMARRWVPTDPFLGDDVETQALRKDSAGWISNGLIDWNSVLRFVNGHFDRLAAASKLSQASERWQAVLAAEMDLEALCVATTKALYLGGGQPSQQVASRQVALKILMNVSSSRWCAKWGEQSGVHGQIAKIALALSAYRREHGRYPDTLGTLRRHCPAELLKDPYYGDELRYGRRGDGYFLHSVGPNGKDEGGPGGYWVLGDDESLRKSDDVGVLVACVDPRRAPKDRKGVLTSALTKAIQNRLNLDGQSVPDFTIAEMEPTGKAGKFTKNQLTGKVTVIQVWDRPEELAKVEELIKAYEKIDGPIVFVAINRNRGAFVHDAKTGHLEWKYPAQLRAEANLLGRKNVRVTIDWDGLLPNALGIGDAAGTAPLLLVADRKGIIQAVDFGSKPDSWPLAKLKNAIDGLLAK